MSLKAAGVIEIPGAAGSAFDHGIFDAKSRRVFIAHTAQSAIEVIDPDAGRHIATLPGFPGVAGAVADDGEILVTNRGSASISWLDAATFKTRSALATGARPNGAAIVRRLSLGIAACIGDEREAPTLQAFRLNNGQCVKLDLPGRPRWCVTDAVAERLFLCIREPSMNSCRRPAGPAPHGPMAASFRRRAWPRHRSRARTSLRRMRCRRSRRGRQRIWRGHQRLAHRWRTGCDILQSGHGPCPCRHRRSGTGRNRRSQNRQGDADGHRCRRAHHGAGAAGSAIRDLTSSRWSSCT